MIYLQFTYAFLILLGVTAFVTGMILLSETRWGGAIIFLVTVSILAWITAGWIVEAKMKKRVYESLKRYEIETKIENTNDHRLQAQ